jgi:hypothetical protein
MATKQFRTTGPVIPHHKFDYAVFACKIHITLGLLSVDNGNYNFRGKKNLLGSSISLLRFKISKKLHNRKGTSIFLIYLRKYLKIDKFGILSYTETLEKQTGQKSLQCYCISARKN